jgi:hypothetical protein
VAFGAALALAGPSSAAPLVVPEYAVGDTARVEVVTPIQLIAIDPARTEALRQAEARRVPAFYRLDATAADEAEAGFRAHFRQTREAFLAALAEALPRRRNNAQLLTNARFLRLVANFPGRHRGFPLTTNLARAWALGQRDDAAQEDWAAKLREAMRRQIRADAQPAEARVGPPQVRLLALERTAPTPALDAAEQQALPAFRTNFLPLSRARAEWVSAVPTEEQAVAKYLASFLKENCVFEADLTRQARARRTEAIFAADHFAPGDVLARAGQVVDPRIKAALDELRARTAADQAKAQAEAALDQLRQQAALAEFKSQHFGQQNRWLLGGLVLVALLSSVALWRVARGRRTPTLLPAPIRHAADPTVFSSPTGHGTGAEPGADNAAWRARALTAEQRAAQASAVVRAGLMPHLAQWLKQAFTRRLVSERAHLLTTTEQAAAAVAELEKRLQQLHAPVEERLRAYEQRIAQLEQALAAKGAENRELLKTQIELTRQKLAAARAQDWTN